MRSGADGVSAHVLPSQPISNAKNSGRQARSSLNAIDRVARRSPDGAAFQLGRSEGMGGEEDFREGQDGRLDDLVIEEDTIECTVDTVVDVIYRGESAKSRRGKMKETYT